MKLICITYLTTIILLFPSRSLTNNKLSFLFKKNDLFCPQKHKKTSVENICYLVSQKPKKTYAEAERYCRNLSHHLAIINNEISWQNAKYGLDQTLTKYDPTKNLTFYAQLDFFKEAKNNIEPKYFCNNSTNYIKESNNTCLVLKYYYNLDKKSAICLKALKCTRSAHALCEWNGDEVESYSFYLRTQIKNASFSILFALILFFTFWTLLYLYHRQCTKNELNHHLNSYLKEKEIFYLD
jgi:hypothetical protein